MSQYSIDYIERGKQKMAIKRQREVSMRETSTVEPTVLKSRKI